MARHSIAQARRVPKYPEGPHAHNVKLDLALLEAAHVHPTDILYVRGYNGEEPTLLVRWGVDENDAQWVSADDFLSLH